MPCLPHLFGWTTSRPRGSAQTSVQLWGALRARQSHTNPNPLCATGIGDRVTDEPVLYKGDVRGPKLFFCSFEASLKMFVTRAWKVDHCVPRLYIHAFHWSLGSWRSCVWRASSCLAADLRSLNSQDFVSK